MSLLAVPIMLCDGLLIIVAELATDSALTNGVLVGLVVAVLGIVVTLLVQRSMRNKVKNQLPSLLAPQCCRYNPARSGVRAT